MAEKLKILSLVVCVVLSVVRQSLGNYADSKAVGDRILNGQFASPGQFPSQALVMVEPDTPICGGSLVSPDAVLTSARCASLTRSDQNLVVGLGYVSSAEQDHGSPHILVTKIHVHPDASKSLGQNDIAVLKLSRSLEYSPIISAIPLATNEEDASEGSHVIVSGWGAKDHRGATERRLLFAKMSVYPLTECRKFYDIITPRHLCAFQEHVNAICTGDSGAPLISNGKLAGLVSYADPGCRRNPVVFTRVSSYLPWIHSKIH